MRQLRCRVPLAMAFFFGITLVVAQGISAQAMSWTNTEGTVSVSFPDGWERWDGTGQLRLYSPAAADALPGSHFFRRTGGILRRRVLHAAVYLVSEQRRDEFSVRAVGELVKERIREGYPVVDTYDLPERDILAYAYRFRHSGAPVSQVMIFFGDTERRVFMLEVTGPRRDEDVLIGEGRQLANSIRVRR